MWRRKSEFFITSNEQRYESGYCEGMATIVSIIDWVSVDILHLSAVFSLLLIFIPFDISAMASEWCEKFTRRLVGKT